MRAILLGLGLVVSTVAGSASATPLAPQVQAIIEPMDLRLRHADLTSREAGKRLDAQVCRTSRSPSARSYAIETAFFDQAGAVVEKSSRNVMLRSNGPRRQPPCAFLRLPARSDIARVELRVRSN